MVAKTFLQSINLANLQHIYLDAIDFTVSIIISSSSGCQFVLGCAPLTYLIVLPMHDSTDRAYTSSDSTLCCLKESPKELVTALSKSACVVAIFGSMCF